MGAPSCSQISTDVKQDHSSLTGVAAVMQSVRHTLQQ